MKTRLVPVEVAAAAVGHYFAPDPRLADYSARRGRRGADPGQICKLTLAPGQTPRHGPRWRDDV